MSGVPPRTKRVGIIAFNHESNTFIPETTALCDFEGFALARGEEVRTRFRDAPHEVSGFFDALEDHGIEAVPILFAAAAPWGRVRDEVLLQLWEEIAAALDRVRPLDGVLVAPHGAGVSESRDDLDGWWLQKLREKVGPAVPIVGTIDPHANLTPLMVRSCEALVAYRENPHLDQRARGVEAALILIRNLAGEIKPVTCAAFPPLAINIECQLTSAEPWLGISQDLDQWRARPGVVSLSVTFGFPYADIEYMGTAVLVTTDDNAAQAREICREISSMLIDRRESLRGKMISAEQAMAMLDDSVKPVGLLDMGDNMGGGAPGDSMILSELCLAQKRWRTLICIPDEESVQQSVAAGLGKIVNLSIGGKLPMSPSCPVIVKGRVVVLHDGKFQDAKPGHGGISVGDMGQTAVVESEQSHTIVLVSRRTGAVTSTAPFLALGIDLAAYGAIVLKGVHAPVGGFRSICASFIRVNTPGVTTAEMTSLVYRNRRRPLFPFEEEVGETEFIEAKTNHES